MIDEQRIRQAPRLCFFAHYHQDGIVAPHVLHYLRALEQAGFTTVVLSTAGLDEAGCQALRAAGAEVILRENHGMDFGGWIEACRRFFPIQAELLLLANDSVYGPLTDLTPFVDRLLAQEADFYGAVLSHEIEPHLQSWFILLRPSAYRSPAFAQLMGTPMPDIADKLTLVTRYEVGLTRRLADAGLRYHAAFDPARRAGIVRRYPYNAAHLLWRDMIEAGVPFLKVELLRLNRMRVTDIDRYADVVRSHSPALAEMILADLAQRGTQPPPSFVAASSLPPVYWPELRAMVLSDYRASPAENRMRALLRRSVLHLVLAATFVPRRIHHHLHSRRPGRSGTAKQSR